jgi:hypothetical protein
VELPGTIVVDAAARLQGIARVHKRAKLVVLVSRAPRDSLRAVTGRVRRHYLLVLTPLDFRRAAQYFFIRSLTARR